MEELNSYQYLKDSGLDVLIAAKGDAFNGLTMQSKALLKSLGCQQIDRLTHNESYYAVIDPGKTLISENVGDALLEDSGKLSDGTDFSILSAGTSQGNRVSIVIDNMEYALNNRGLNFVVYDPRLGCVVDTACFDTYNRVYSCTAMDSADTGLVSMTHKVLSNASIQRVEVQLDDITSGRTECYYADLQDNNTYLTSFQKPEADGAYSISIYVTVQNGYRVRSEYYNGSWDELKDGMFSQEELLLPDELNLYLERLIESDYDVLIAVKDDANNGLMSQNKLLLEALGCRRIKDLEFRDSYYAVLDANHSLISEGIGQEKLEYSGKLSDGAAFSITSAGYSNGNLASIVIENMEYALDSRGLNFVVYDSQSGRVVDNSCFDTYDNWAVSQNEMSFPEAGLVTMSIKAQSSQPIRTVEVRILDTASGKTQSYYAQQQTDDTYTVTFDEPDKNMNCRITVFVINDNGYIIETDRYAGTWKSIKKSQSSRQKRHL